MKKPGLVVIETLIAVGAALVLAGLIYAYRGALADKISHLRGKDKPVVVATPPPSPLITPLIPSTFKPTGDGSIAEITPTPTPIVMVDSSGNPLPSSGPEDALWIVLGGAVAGLMGYRYYRLRQQVADLQSGPSIL